MYSHLPVTGKPLGKNSQSPPHVPAVRAGHREHSSGSLSPGKDARAVSRFGFFFKVLFLDFNYVYICLGLCA